VNESRGQVTPASDVTGDGDQVRLSLLREFFELLDKWDQQATVVLDQVGQIDRLSPDLPEPRETPRDIKNVGDGLVHFDHAKIARESEQQTSKSG
jgi:hypothetical protein